MTWDVMSGVTKTAWDVMSGVTKTAWDVLSGVANLCGMFCPGWQKMAWDVLSRDVLSGSRCFWCCIPVIIHRNNNKYRPPHKIIIPGVAD